MSGTNENRNTSARGYRPSGPVRVGRVGDWNNSSAAESASSSRGGSGPRIATLGSLGGGSSSPRPSRPPADDSDEDEKKEGETWFSGGERSGINVQNPNAAAGSSGGLINDIFRQATENSRARAARGEEATTQAPRRFTGGGYTLGNEEEMSRYVPDDEDGDEDGQRVETRYITFWRNGFTIADGELRDYESPENRMILARITQGDAPMDLLNVGPDQLVDLQITNKKDEDYTPPPQPIAFRGSGNRLGAPVPSEVASSSQLGPSSAASQPQGSPQTSFEVDQTQPTTNVQIRFADGSKMVAKMNLTHTVGDIRGIINASQPLGVFRPYDLSTTFPNRVLADNSATIEAAGLKNSVVVQRWAD